MLKQFDKWHKTRNGYIVVGVVELGLAYLFASLAIDSGRLLQWALSFLFLFGGAQNIVKSVIHWKKD